MGLDLQQDAHGHRIIIIEHIHHPSALVLASSCYVHGSWLLHRAEAAHGALVVRFWTPLPVYGLSKRNIRCSTIPSPNFSSPLAASP